MIPSQFAYEAPSTITEATNLLSEAPMDTKVLAGGQSLIPVLKLRMADPELVIGLQHIAEMAGVRRADDHLIIGPMTRHAEIASDPLIASHASLLSDAATTIADPQVRQRGTIGGSIVHADPAGDMAACLLCLDAEMTIAGRSGSRTVPAAEFFLDYFTTALDDDEILTEIHVPFFEGWTSSYEKFNRVAQQWSIVSAAAAVRLQGGSIAEARIGLTNMDATPIRATAVETALAGCELSEAAITAACADAAEGTDPPSDLNGDAAYRRHLAVVLTRRAVMHAAQIAPQQSRVHSWS